jgi:hypothetical protein
VDLTQLARSFLPTDKIKNREAVQELYHFMESHKQFKDFSAIFSSSSSDKWEDVARGLIKEEELCRANSNSTYAFTKNDLVCIFGATPYYHGVGGGAIVNSKRTFRKPNGRIVNSGKYGTKKKLRPGA